MSKMHIKTGDTVMVIAGKDKDKKGKVLRTYPDRNKVIIEDVAIVTKHRKPSAQVSEGGRIQIPAPIHASNALLFCSKCDKGVRTGIKMVDSKKKRYCKKCSTVLD